ncbi:hypothetical protein [Desulfobacula sp.]|uniref:hypothetical protein n=1 Tax=Desulfobacula sp. TaxID=2593537 RepID=UPI001ED680CD|nr:hypothetical protein [Desulfobacula sp.]
MGNLNIIEPTNPPKKSIPNLKDYRCPHCNKFLFKGDVKKLNMACHHCQKWISATDPVIWTTAVPTFWAAG